MPKKKTNWHAQKLTSAASRNNFGGVAGSNAGIQNDDAGIFVTCDKGKEGKCVAECVDLLERAAVELGYIKDPMEEELDKDDDDLDIEASIAAELEALKPGKKDAGKGKKTMFRVVRLDIPCVSFIKVLSPLDPTKLVHHICTSALNNLSEKQSRYVKRLTPMTRMKKTLSDGLDILCDVVLKDYFGPGSEPKTYAIRPTCRNNDQLNRDVVIKKVADWIGKDHTVDLKNYDLLVLVEVYRNVVGMSVVTDFEKLKRFNLTEIYDPTPILEKGKKPPSSTAQQKSESETTDEKKPEEEK